MLKIVTRICDGNGREGDLETLEGLTQVLGASSLCSLGKTASDPLLSGLRYFRDEYEAHIKEKRCPANSCKALVAKAAAA